MKFTKPLFEVANVISMHRDELEHKGKLTTHQKKVFTSISNCRTEALGHHKDKCNNPDCGHVHISYNSCRNRHCPKCNGSKREKWINAREKDFLPVKYYHVVFTLADTLNPLILKYQELMFNLLFKSAWETIRKFGNDHKHLGAKMGMIVVLHTWGQNIAYHPHVHCIVPAGGITKNGKWRNTKNEGKFLFPVKALSSVFRGIFTDKLIELDNKGDICLDQKFISDKKYLHPYYKHPWVVYAKLPMYNAMQVVNYIGKYSHRIAISNHRIKKFENGRVEFSYFNYRTSKAGNINMSAEEFLRRFAQHILPPGFMKIRHYGFLSAKNKSKAIELAREQLDVNIPITNNIHKTCAPSNVFQFICPVCKIGKMIVIEVCPPKNRGSPMSDITFNYKFYGS